MISVRGIDAVQVVIAVYALDRLGIKDVVDLEVDEAR
jgi:hypothetical protein